MNKQEQIEEMAHIMCKYYNKGFCANGDITEICKDMPYCCYKNDTEALYGAGYRKVGSDAKGNLLKIQNLCIEFDEMGYEPTTLCENPEQTAKKWKSDLMYEIGLFLDEAMGIKARYNELKAENERLTKILNSRRMVADELIEATQKAYKEGYEKGAEEMRLEAKKPIEKFIKQRERQAVKEFSKKLIKLVFDYLGIENAEQAEKLSIIDSTLTYDVILHAIDKLIEEEN